MLQSEARTAVKYLVRKVVEEDYPRKKKENTVFQRAKEETKIGECNGVVYQMSRIKERISTDTSNTKVFLKKHMETYYFNSVLKYINI